jgi:hypothetical protein
MSDIKHPDPYYTFVTGTPTSLLNIISTYFDVSEQCAAYMYYRSLRGIRNDHKHMDYTIQLQNAIVKVDKCLGVDWAKINFDQEADEFAGHGILIDEMDEIVFRWVQEIEDDGWTPVTNRKKKNNIISTMRKVGIFV